MARTSQAARSRGRASDAQPVRRVTRSSNSAKTNNPTPNKGKGSKASLKADAFKSQALPLHVNITHTPPVLTDEETVDVAQTDPGFIGSTALTPTTFSTGSYGWKGTKRVTVEVKNEETGKLEKLQVLLTFNATVLGSKNAEDDEVKVKGGEEGDESPVGPTPVTAEIEMEKEEIDDA